MPAAAAGHGNLKFHLNIVTSCQHAHTVVHHTVRKLFSLPCLQQPCMRESNHEQLQFVYNICVADLIHQLCQKIMHNDIQ